MQLEKYKNGRVRDVLKFLDRETIPRVERTLFSGLGNIKRRGYRNAFPKAASQTVDRATKQLNDDLLKLSRTLQNELNDLAINEANWLKAQIDSRVPLVSMRVPSDKLLREIVAETPIQGITYGTHWRRVAGNVVGQVRQSVTIGLAEGDSVPQMVSRINWAGTKRQTEALVRTAVTQTSAQARALTALENDDVIKGERWVSTLDSRTTVICANLDGRVFPLGEGPRPPAHINCRSTMVPVTKSWEELGLDGEELDAPTRASINGQVPATETYPQWLRKQSKSVQDEVLGPTRANLWRGNRLKFSRFVNDQNQVLTLEQLGR